MQKITLVNFLLLLILSYGCSYFKRKGDWGRDALWPISGSKISQAFKKNISSPYVWAPAAGAAAIYITDQDDKITSWAAKTNPIFGSQENANRYSDDLRNVLYVETAATVILTPSWNGSEGDYLLSKSKGALVTYLAFSLSEDTTNNIRKYVKRERPDGSDLRSLPSGHATGAGATEAILRRNTRELGLSPTWVSVLNGVNTTLAAGVMWSRVEANDHHPTDVLLGYSLGNFVSGFVFDSLMNLDSNEHVAFYPNERKGMTLSYSFAF